MAMMHRPAAGVTGLTLSLTLKGVKSAVSSYTGSVKYLKRIVPLSICNILYNRIDLDPKFFKDQNIADIEFKCFMPKIKHHVVCDVYWWCKGAAEAIEKKYLKEMYMYLKDKETGNIIEHYKFIFQYNEEEPVCRVESDEILKETRNLFDMLRSMNKFEKLSAETDILMELTYFDITPDGYTPSGYSKITNRIPLLCTVNNTDASEDTLANIKTGYHTMKCKAFGLGDYNQYTVGLNGVSGQEVDADESLIVEPEDDLFDADTVDLKQGPGCRPGSVLSISDNQDDLAETVEDMTENPAMKCVCGLQYSFRLSDETACTNCQTLQHTICIGYTEDPHVPKPYVCLKCGTKAKPPTDFKVFEASPSKQKRVCGLRLVYWHCYKTMQFPVKFFAMFEEVVRKTLQKHLAKLKCISIAEDNSVTLNFVQFANEMSLIFYDYVVPESMTLESEPGTQPAGIEF